MGFCIRHCPALDVLGDVRGDVLGDVRGRSREGKTFRIPAVEHTHKLLDVQLEDKGTPHLFELGRILSAPRQGLGARVALLDRRHQPIELLILLHVYEQRQNLGIRPLKRSQRVAVALPRHVLLDE